MRRNILSKAAWLVLLAALSACGTKRLAAVKRPTTDSAAAVRTSDLATRLAAIRSKQVTFNTFSGKAKTKLAINGNENDVTLNIRVNRDQKIWISITAIAGIEVARALITPDSIQVVNRLQNVYLKKPFSYVYKYAGRQVNFRTLQALLVGNAIGELLNENAKFTPEGANTSLTGNLNGLAYKLLLGADLRATQTNLANQQAGQSLQVANRVFTQADGRIVPSEIDITSNAPGNKALIYLRYTKVEFDKPLEYPFSIPKSYEPAE